MYVWHPQPASHQRGLPEGRKEGWRERKKVGVKEGVGREGELQTRGVTAGWARTQKRHCWNCCRESLEDVEWEWGIKNRTEWSLIHWWRHAERVRLYWESSYYLSEKWRRMTPPPLTLERNSAKTHPLPPLSLSHHPQEMQPQVDVSGSSLSAVSAVFISVALTPCWQHLCWFSFPSERTCTSSQEAVMKWSLPSDPPMREKRGREGEKKRRWRENKRKISMAIWLWVAVIIISSVPSRTPCACYACPKWKAFFTPLFPEFRFCSNITMAL